MTSTPVAQRTFMSSNPGIEFPISNIAEDVISSGIGQDVRTGDVFGINVPNLTYSSNADLVGSNGRTERGRRISSPIPDSAGSITSITQSRAGSGSGK